MLTRTAEIIQILRWSIQIFIKIVLTKPSDGKCRIHYASPHCGTFIIQVVKMLTKIEFVCQNPCKWFSANRDICRFLVGGRNYRGPHFSQKEANCCPKRNRGAFCSLPRLSPFVFFSFSRLVFAHRSKGKISKNPHKGQRSKIQKKIRWNFFEKLQRCQR